MVAAAGTDLPDMVQKSQFHRDLYYRIAVVDISLRSLMYKLKEYEIE